MTQQLVDQGNVQPIEPDETGMQQEIDKLLAEVDVQPSDTQGESVEAVQPATVETPVESEPPPTTDAASVEVKAPEPLPDAFIAAVTDERKNTLAARKEAEQFKALADEYSALKPQWQEYLAKQDSYVESQNQQITTLAEQNDKLMQELLVFRAQAAVLNPFLEVASQQGLDGAPSVAQLQQAAKDALKAYREEQRWTMLQQQLAARGTPQTASRDNTRTNVTTTTQETRPAGQQPATVRPAATTQPAPQAASPAFKSEWAEIVKQAPELAKHEARYADAHSKGLDIKLLAEPVIQHRAKAIAAAKAAGARTSPARMPSGGGSVGGKGGVPDHALTLDEWRARL